MLGILVALRRYSVDRRLRIPNRLVMAGTSPAMTEAVQSAAETRQGKAAHDELGRDSENNTIAILLRSSAPFRSRRAAPTCALSREIAAIR